MREMENQQTGFSGVPEQVLKVHALLSAVSCYLLKKKKNLIYKLTRGLCAPPKLTIFA